MLTAPSGDATTFFIEKNARDLFNFEGHGSLRSSKLLTYLADMVRGTWPGKKWDRVTAG